jgi:aryl-alcohol dehydrogenase-like predicted oxidoreductase
MDEALLPPVRNWCKVSGIAILCYSPLCRSLLAGRLQRGMTFDAGDIRRVDPKFQEPHFSQYRSAVERLAAFARERYSKSVLELAVRWVLDRPGISVALWGAKRPQQLDAVSGVMGWKLDAAAMAEIDRIVNESVTDPVGPEYLTPKVREG